jgi:methyl-accepting chemotaxis protein
MELHVHIHHHGPKGDNDSEVVALLKEMIRQVKVVKQKTNKLMGKIEDVNANVDALRGTVQNIANDVNLQLTKITELEALVANSAASGAQLDELNAQISEIRGLAESIDAVTPPAENPENPENPTPEEPTPGENV